MGGACRGLRELRQARSADLVRGDGPTETLELELAEGSCVDGLLHGGEQALPTRPTSGQSLSRTPFGGAATGCRARFLSAYWKISVVQSPFWSRTSWARAGPPGRLSKSMKKSGSTVMPPSGWQSTLSSQERR